MNYLAKQYSNENNKGKYELTLVVKRTYHILDDGSCKIADEQIPIYDDVVMDKKFPEMITNASDFNPDKPLTDLVIIGNAYNPSDSNTFKASVSIKNSSFKLLVIGDRKVYFNSDGTFAFTEAAPIKICPLSYEYAYGGKDLIAEKPIRDAVEKDPNSKYLIEVMNIFQGSPYRYPRNPVGKGYIVEANEEAIAQLELPNLEDPDNPLNPDSLLCADPFKWYKMPLPVCTGWTSPAWFPRIAYFGGYQLPEGLDENLKEIKNKMATPELLESTGELKKAKFKMRAYNAASLGLQLNSSIAKQDIILSNMHPSKQEYLIKIPKQAPSLKVDGRNGKLLKVTPKLHTIEIHPEQNRLVMVWSGSGKALRPYQQEELRTMPYEVKW